MAYELKDKDGKLVKRNGEQVFVSDRASIVKGVNLELRQLSIIGTDETQDRDGDIIMVNGWELENFIPNPVFLWAHDYRGVPIAAASKLLRKRVPKPHMVFVEQFAPEGIYPFADMILQLYSIGQINASSVGFIPKKHEKLEMPEEDRDRFYNPRRFLKQELLELSGCAVPSNPAALQLSIKDLDISASLNADKVLDYIIGKDFPEVSNQDDILAEMDKISKNFEFEDELKPFMVQVPGDIGDKDADVEEELSDVETLCGKGSIEITKDDVEKPYANEHACRLKDPSNFDRFARNNCAQKHDGKCIDVIYGIKESKTEVQALRYKKDTWNVSSAREHCKGRKGKFEPAKDSIVSVELGQIDCDDNLCYINDDFVISLTDLESLTGKISAFMNDKNFSMLTQAVEMLKEVMKSVSIADEDIDQTNLDTPGIDPNIGESQTSHFDLILSDRSEGTAVKTVVPAVKQPVPVAKPNNYGSLVSELRKLTTELKKLGI